MHVDTVAFLFGHHSLPVLVTLHFCEVLPVLDLQSGAEDG